MTFKKVGLLTLLISLFIFNGCKNPTTIGLDLAPNLALDSKIAYDSTIVTKLVKEDSIAANYQTNSPIGFFKDPDFGTTQSDMAAALTLPNNIAVTFDRSATLDSAVLVLPFSGFYGDSINTQFKIDVRQMDEKIYESDAIPTYYNTKQWAHKSTVIGSSNIFGANSWKDSITIANIRVGKSDTIQKVIPQLRIKLDKATITQLFLNADSAKLSTNDQFNNYFKGLYISMNKASTTNNGGIFLFNTSTAGSARLDLFYKQTKTAGVTDTLQTSFGLTGNTGNVVSPITWDYSNTTIASELAKNNSEKLYLKGLSGTKVKVTFPNLKNLNSLGKNIIINRAELIVNVVGGTQAPYKPLPLIKVYRWDIANRPQLLPDESANDPRNIGAGYIGGAYNTIANTYIFNMTAYIQDLLKGNTDYGTFISAMNFTTPNSQSSILGRSILGGGLGKYKMKLKVYYTDQK
jgi:hypothetical protein